jgi:hypothetical protein
VKEKETSIKQNYQAKCKRKNYKQLTNNKEAHRISCTNKNEIQQSPKFCIGKYSLAMQIILYFCIISSI